MKRRVFAAITALCMLASPVCSLQSEMMMTSVTAHAATSIGGNLTWTLDEEGTLTISGTGDMYPSFESSPFSLDENIKKIVIEPGVTSIGSNAFWDCPNLTSVTIPNTVKKIGANAFEFCMSLTSVTIPDSVKTIEDHTFEGCTSLTEVTIPDGVTSIKYRAFFGCESLTTVTIPGSVTSIGEDAFLECTSLTSVTIPDSVTSIESGTFRRCTGLTTVTIPDSVTSIKNGAFSGCSSLTSLTIPDGVTSIDSRAFQECTSLSTVTIPDSVISIGYSAFEDCSSLTSITILNPKCDIAEYQKTISNDDSFSGTIYGYTASTAQAYAEKYGRKYESLGYISGDVNGDGCVNALDAALILKEVDELAAGGTGTFTEEQRKAADAENNRKLENRDGERILSAAVDNALDPSGKIPCLGKVDSIFETTVQQGRIEFRTPKITQSVLESWNYKVPVLVQVDTGAAINSIEFGLSTKLPFKLIRNTELQKYKKEAWYAALTDKNDPVEFAEQYFYCHAANGRAWFSYATGKPEEISGVVGMILVDVSPDSDVEPWVHYVGRTETRTAFVTEVDGDQMILAEPDGIPAFINTLPDNYASLAISKMPAKRNYEIGEELDLSGAEASASGCMDGVYWDVFNEPLDSQYFTVDASAFDNTKPGTYKIYVTSMTDKNASASFEVTVGKTDTAPTQEASGTMDPQETTEEEAYIAFTIKRAPDKLTYQIGEELDLTGGIGYASGRIGQLLWDTFDQPLSYFTVDASEFDNTKPGTYKIYVTAKGGSASKTLSFEVVVTDNGPTVPTTGEEVVTTVKKSSGDIDGSGTTDIMDLIRLNKHLLGMYQMTDSERAAADVNGDDVVDANDSLSLLKKALDIPEMTDPVEATI